MVDEAFIEHGVSELIIRDFMGRLGRVEEIENVEEGNTVHEEGISIEIDFEIKDFEF